MDRCLGTSRLASVGRAGMGKGRGRNLTTIGVSGGKQDVWAVSRHANLLIYFHHYLPHCSLFACLLQVDGPCMAHRS